MGAELGGDEEGLVAHSDWSLSLPMTLVVTKARHDRVL